MTLTLYVDRTKNQFVRGKNDATPYNLPPFFQGSKITLNIFILVPNPTGGLTNPYNVLNITGKNLRVGIGNPVGNNNPIAQTLSFQVGDQSGDKYFYGDFDLNTAEVNAALGSNLEIDQYLEIEISDDGNRWDKLIQLPQKIRATLFSDAWVPVSGPVKLISAAQSPYLVENNIRSVLVTNNGYTVIQLPANTPDGRMVLVKCLGNAQVNNVKVECPDSDFEDGIMDELILDQNLDWAEFLYHYPENKWLIINRKPTGGGGGSSVDEGLVAMIAQVFGR